MLLLSLCACLGVSDKRLGEAYRTPLLFAEPMEYKSPGPELSVPITLGVLRFDKNNTPIKFTTRAYNHAIPGPTIRVRAGTLLRITLQNTLGPDVDGPMNSFHNANTTNIHTHGLHISPSGKADDVSRAVKPGETAVYEYPIPADHPPGTFWYHPHHHGSSTLQLANLLAGALIVEAATPDMEPVEIRAMKDVVMLMHNLCFDHSQVMNPYDDISVLAEWASNSLDPNPDFVNPEDIPDYFLINGQYLPTITMVPGEYQRWRVIQASHATNLALFVKGCEWAILARDGIYHPVPRPDVIPFLVPGSRADIAIRCNKEGTYQLESAPGVAPWDNDLQPYTRIFEGVIAQIVVKGNPVTMSLPAKLPPLPAYMDDLRNIDPKTVAGRFTMRLNAGFGKIQPGEFPDTYRINDKLYSAVPQTRMALNQVQEWTLQAVGGGVNHPFHLHVNHYQINSFNLTTLPSSSSSSSSSPRVSGGAPVTSLIDMQVGDWRDTIATADGWDIGIRFRPDRYDGPAVMHCHMASHADLGMMAIADIVRA